MGDRKKKLFYKRCNISQRLMYKCAYAIIVLYNLHKARLKGCYLSIGMHAVLFNQLVINIYI